MKTPSQANQAEKPQGGREWVWWAGLGLLMCGMGTVLYFIVQGPVEPQTRGKRLSEWLRNPSPSQLQILTEMSPDCFPYMLAMMRTEDPDLWVREHAARNLADFAHHADLVVPTLTARLTDRSVDVRRTAAGSLGRLGANARAAEPALNEALRQSDLTYRKAVEEALRAIDRSGVPDIPWITD